MGTMQDVIVSTQRDVNVLLRQLGDQQDEVIKMQKNFLQEDEKDEGSLEAYRSTLVS